MLNKWGFKAAVLAELLIMALGTGLAIAGVNENLLAASENGHLARINAPLAQGANLNAKTKDGMTALQMAIIKSRMDIATMLAKAWASNRGLAPWFAGY